APALAARVQAGTLPPLAERLPAEPRIMPLAALRKMPGRHGGTLRMLMGDQRDIRFMTVYGYARLVTFDMAGDLVPDILARVEVEAGRVFTLHLRPGHKWSDGHPFTAEDFRYWWEDVATNARLNRSGPPMPLLAAGEPPEFAVLDATTVRYAWKTPNPMFLPALASAQPQVIAMPAHYMKRFHARHAEPAALAAEIKAAKVRDWGALHERKSRSYRPENPDLPALDPWVNRTHPPAERFVFERNPYFHRVDEQGRQLPYLDRVEMAITASNLIPAKVGAGEADLQARYLRFDNYTFLKEAAKRQGYRVLLWEQGNGAQVALKPNLNAADPVWRALFRDVRVRRALSLGINRKDINEAIFFGLGREAANAVLPESPFYDPTHEQAYARHDPAEANRLLDAAGLARRDLTGTRLLPDGRPALLTVDSSGESTEETDVLQLVAEDWAALGIRLFIRSSQRDVFRRRILAGQCVMSVWHGMDNAIPGPDNEPEDLAPTNFTQAEWPLWGLWAVSGGKEGEKPDLPAAWRLHQLHAAWRVSRTREERAAIWREMLAINAEEVFTIGIVNRTRQPVVVSNRLRNVPETAIFAFEPRAYLGAYLPDTFFYAEGGG
ncbi:MAG: ABC transporter substrate-binding protein, partial [Hyphomicrobiales bacterium]|nr:ABC transporter substrate-binding protein [Hyphomicrobiales bacterium]